MNKLDYIRVCCHIILSNKNLISSNGVTYCNIGFYYILRLLGLGDDFVNKLYKEPYLANEMYDILKEKYKQVNIEEVLSNLESGKLYAASIKDNPHGHIALIYPHKTKVYSIKWNKLVPLCVNFGKENGIIGLNWAFNKEPEYFELGEPKCC